MLRRQIAARELLIDALKTGDKTQPDLGILQTGLDELKEELKALEGKKKL